MLYLARVLPAIAALGFLAGVQGLVGCGPAADLLKSASSELLEHKRSCDTATGAYGPGVEDGDAFRGHSIEAVARRRSDRSTDVVFKFQDKDGVANVVLQALVSQLAAAAEPPAEFALVALRRPLEYDGENDFLLWTRP